MLIEENLQVNDWMSQLYERVFSTSEAITDGLELVEEMVSALK